MSNSTKTIVIGLIFFLFCCVASYIAGRIKGAKIGRERGYAEGFEAGYLAPHPSDTLVVTDTLLVERPVQVVSEKIRTEFVAVHDTLRVRDTLYMAVPIEAKVYADSTYRAQVSGWRPSLDWIEVYARTQTITQYIDHPAPRWSFGVTAGPGVVWDGGFHGGLGIVAGLSYRF